MKEIVLYTTGCPKCKVLKEKLDTENIQYIEETDVTIMISLGIQTAPMLKVDNYELMDFQTAVNWIKEEVNK